jgi:PTH1 family peptidyl-tRNA hydrolase
MKLIVGLGNPGSAYSGNRHNIGFVCLGYFARRHRINLDRKQCLARVGSGNAAGEAVVLARPQTYMNNSGRSVVRLLNKLKLSPEDLIVIHDDLDLPLGRIRLRQGGGSGGHNGVFSIIDEIQSQDFYRIRIGIGRPGEYAGEEDIIDFVLSDFTPEEESVIQEAAANASEALDCLLANGLEAAMNRFN